MTKEQTNEIKRFFLTDPYAHAYMTAIDKGDWAYVIKGLEQYAMYSKGAPTYLAAVTHIATILAYLDPRIDQRTHK